MNDVTTTTRANAAGTMSVELDIAFDIDALANALIEMTRDYATITYRVIDIANALNGFPIVRFVGESIDIFEFVLEYCAGNRDDAEFLLDIA